MSEENVLGFICDEDELKVEDKTASDTASLVLPIPAPSDFIAVPEKGFSDNSKIAASAFESLNPHSYSSGILPPKGINVSTFEGLRKHREITQTKLKTTVKKTRRKSRRLNKIFDFIIMGGGEPGKKCGFEAITKVHPLATSAGIGNLSCKRAECPNCSSYEVVKKVKDIAFKVECYARSHNDERPHVMTVSVHPDVEAKWGWSDFEYSLFQRGYRHMKKMGVAGGVSIVHPYRLKSEIADALRQKIIDDNGLKDGEKVGGLWALVRRDALNLGSWREYVKLGLHDHSIGFPGFVDSHSDKDIVIKKYDELQNLESVIKHLLYLVGHSGVAKTESGTKDSVKWWGSLNGHAKIPTPLKQKYMGDKKYLQEREAKKIEQRERDIVFAKKWLVPETPLSFDEKEGIKKEIEDIIDGLDYVKKKDKEVTECPLTGTPIEDFIPVHALPFCLKDGGWQSEICAEHGVDLGETLISDLDRIVAGFDKDGDVLLDYFDGSPAHPYLQKIHLFPLLREEEGTKT